MKIPRFVGAVVDLCAKQSLRWAMDCVRLRFSKEHVSVEATNGVCGIILRAPYRPDDNKPFPQTEPPEEAQTRVVSGRLFAGLVDAIGEGHKIDLKPVEGGAVVNLDGIEIVLKENKELDFPPIRETFEMVSGQPIFESCIFSAARLAQLFAVIAKLDDPSVRFKFFSKEPHKPICIQILWSDPDSKELSGEAVVMGRAGP